MRYSFDVTVTEKDYYEFNKFHMKHSSYGKRYHRILLIILIVAVAAFSLYIMASGGFAIDSVVLVVPYVGIAVIMSLCYIPVELAFLKLNIKTLKKSGKTPYSERSRLEFYDESFVEITADSKNENRYSAIDCVYASKARGVYVYLNSILAYTMPYTVFESDEQYSEFVEFLKEKTEKITVMEDKK